MDAINYSAINLTGVNKLESNIKKEEELTALEDGLDQKELKSIDQNKDGVITEEEFKKKYGAQDDSYKAVWNAYSQAFCKSSAKTNNDGTTQVTQKINGNEIISTYNKAGELVSYTTKVKGTDGKLTEQNYSIDNKTGKHTLDATLVYNKAGKLESKATTADNGATVTTKYRANGTTPESITTKNPNNTTLIEHCNSQGIKDGTTTQITADGTSVKRDKNGNITNLTFNKVDPETGKKSTEKVNYTYKNGVINTVTINGKTYKGDQITTKDGKITVKNGKQKVLVMKTHSQNEEGIYLYGKDGKLDSKLLCASDGYAKSIFTYDKKGLLADRTYCQTGRYRTYHRGKDGKVDYSIDYNKQGGRKLTKQTYLDQTNNDIYKNNDEALWDTRTYYDKNGNVSKYCEMSYKRNSDDTVNVTTKQYDKKGGTLQKTTKKHNDSYANNLETKEYDAKNNLQKTTEVSYKDDMNEKKTKADVTEKRITDASGQLTTEKYDCTKLMSKDVQGQYKEEYTYHSSGAMETKLHTPADGKSYTFSTYRGDGTNETESFYRHAGTQRDIIMNNKQFDEKGNLELNTDYTYNNFGYSWQKNNEITTTDKDGKLVNLKKHDRFGNRNYEKNVYSDGSSTETNYRQINSGEFVPNKVEDKDAEGNVTKSQRSLFQVIKDRYPNLLDSQVQMICSTYIAPFNTNIDGETLLTEDAIKNVDLSHFKVSPNGLVTPA